jgi:hypothetical protein
MIGGSEGCARLVPYTDGEDTLLAIAERLLTVPRPRDGGGGGRRRRWLGGGGGWCFPP